MPTLFDSLKEPVRELVKKSPDNPITRSVLRKHGFIIPSNLSGVNKVIDFINNSKPPKIQSTSSVNIRNVNPTPNNRDTRIQSYLDVDVYYSETEYGSCTYSVSRSGSESVRVPIDIIREAILEDDDGKILDYIRDNLNRDGMDDYDDYVYENHDYSDSDHYEDDVNYNMARDLISRYINAYGDPNEETEDDDIVSENESDESE